MTTVDKVLLKLDYVSKEQENELAFFALDDVIDRFETAIAVIYSEAGIPLKSYDYLVKEESEDLEGFEDVNLETGLPTGIKLPYVVTVDEGSRTVLSVRRNYAPNDPTKKKIQYFVHFKFLPGLGFYGFGLIHMIGGLSRTATVALRQLLDAGTLSNLPAGFKIRGVRVRDDAQPIQPGEFRDVDAPGGSLKDALQFLPYKEPSQTLRQ